jgi:hypothetical protein
MSTHATYTAVFTCRSKTSLPCALQSPNYEHVKHAQAWIDAYPAATSWACPGLIEQEPEIAFEKTIGVNNATPEGWPEQVRHVLYDAAAKCCAAPSEVLCRTTL